MSDQSSLDRPVKSYLERYHDIKNMLNNSDRDGTSHQPVDSTYTSSTMRYSSASHRNTELSRKNDDPISIHQIDDESSKTLERWESRKERKRAEDPSYAARTVDTFKTPTSSNRGSRWTPKSDYGHNYDSPEPNVRKGVIDAPRGDSSPLFNDVELSPNEDVRGNNPLVYNQNSVTNAEQSKKKSYAESLQSFSNAISSSVARDIARDYWSRPLAANAAEKTDVTNTSPSHHEDAKQYRPDPESIDYQDPEGDEKYIGRRIRMGGTTATECCKRFGCQTPDEEEVWQNPDEFKPVWSSSSKRSWHIYAAVLVCVGCVIATAFTVKYVSGGRSATYAMRMTSRPTVSSMPSYSPSEKPSGMPSDAPTNRPTSERERLLSEYLVQITDGVSNVEGSPQFEAKIWLLYEDGLNLSLPSYASDELMRVVKERIKQRYALAALYYSMGIGEGGVLKGWLEGDECRFVGDYGSAWDGVDCDEEGEVRALAIGKSTSCEWYLQTLFIALNSTCFKQMEPTFPEVYHAKYLFFTRFKMSSLRTTQTSVAIYPTQLEI